MYLSMLIVVVIFQIKLHNYGAYCAVHESLANHQQQHYQAPHHHHHHHHHHHPLHHDQQLHLHRLHLQEVEPRRIRKAANYEQYSRQPTNYNNNNNNNHHLDGASSSSSAFYQNEQPQILEQCCACDEAKYELVFEGLWSKYTHPDDFPANPFSASFSDIIGASHSNEFRLWQHDTFASEGVKELAESGSTKKLESELKQVSSKTRTIIKARELHYPTLNSKTSAVFRTDRQHHLVSILSKLSPSPDWMVGVSGLELCLTDCSWVSQRIVNLYLWDAGTDSGATFLSPDMPSRPQEKIHPYKKMTVSSSGSGNSSGSVSKYNEEYNSSNITNYQSASQGINFEQAALSANTQRRSPSPDQASAFGQQNYDSSSNPFSSSNGLNNLQQSQRNSQLEPTKPFARLTITRQRIYEKSCGATDYPARSYQSVSRVPPVESWQNADGGQSASSTLAPSSDCRFTEWSDWSSCSSICGKGIRTRTRSFVDEQAHLAGCSQIDLIEKQVCLAECFGSEVCITHEWSDWSNCSVNCGEGYRQKTRAPIGAPKAVCQNLDFVVTEPCVGSQNPAECSPSEETSPAQQQANDSAKKCEVSNWSQWSECSVACGKGIRIRTRQFARREDADRKACSNTKLVQKQSCTGRFGSSCAQTSKRITEPSEGINPDLPVIDCKLSAWSRWSTCSALCGSGKRTKSRHIIQMPQNGGKACDKRLTRTQACKNLPPCPPSSSSHQQQHNNNNNNSNNQANNTHSQAKHSQNGARKGQGNNKSHSHHSKNNQESWRVGTTTTTTTPGSSMMDDEDDMEDKHRRSDDIHTCAYANWTQWSDCEVVCQPVKKGSNKVRQRFPLDGQSRSECRVIEEIYYCDPNVYC